MSVATIAANRAHLSHSLPLVLQHRDQLLERLEAQLVQVEADGDAQKASVAAMVLFELLLDAARSIVARGEPTPAPDLAAEHAALGIGGRHYSRFGDALVPALKDISLPAPVAAVWCDSFWAAIRASSGLREAVGA